MQPQIPLPASMFSEQDRARFWARVKRGSSCWLWAGAKTQWGYGAFTKRHAGKKLTIAAHRLSYALEHGDCPTDKVVCHSCDVRNCVNPDHLWVGTNDDNMADMVSKGTLKGEGQHNAKLDTWDVICIRADRRKQRTIAVDYGVSQSCVMLIKTRRNWAHIPEMEF